MHTLTLSLAFCLLTAAQQAPKPEATKPSGEGLPVKAEGGFVSLMPKTDIGEHWIAEGAPAEIWSVKDGVIHCRGTPNGFLRSRKSYRNYIFRAEWRFRNEGWTKPPPAWPNAGFFIHAGAVNNGWPISLEVQGHFGEAGSLFGVRGGKVTGARRGPIVKDRPPFGEWDRYEIIARNGRVKVILNGRVVNEGWHVEPSAGNICLQSEGWEVHYRNVAIQELDEAAFPPQSELERDLEEVARVAILTLDAGDPEIGRRLAGLAALQPYRYELNLWRPVEGRKNVLRLALAGSPVVSQFATTLEEVEMNTAMRRVFDAGQRMTVASRPGWTSVLAPVLNGRREIAAMVEVVCRAP